MPKNRPLTRRDFPAWVLTVDAMIAAGGVVQARCDRCALCRPADLDAIRRAKGGNYSLIDKRTRCTATGCNGWVRVHYLQGVMRRLWTDEASLR